MSTDRQIEIAVVVDVSPGHGRLLQRSDILIGRYELADVEDLLLRPGRTGKCRVDRLNAPVVLVGRQTAQQRLVGLETRIARPRRNRTGKDIARARLCANAQVIGELIAL